MEKEERLSRMEMRRKEWETGYICKDIMEDILEEMVEKEADEQELKDKRIESLMKVIKEYGLEGTTSWRWRRGRAVSMSLGVADLVMNQEQSEDRVTGPPVLPQ